MRSIEDIRDTGAAWVTEPELAMLCAFAKRAEQSEAEVARQALLVQRYEPAYLGLPHVVRERDEARAEAERLREALERIDAEAGCPAAEYVPALPRIWEIARAAMRGGGE